MTFKQHILTIALRLQVADLYNLSSYDMVTVNRISREDTPLAKEEVSADFVTVTIKEQYISRGDMHFFQQSLIGKWIYEGQRLSNTTKVRLKAEQIFVPSLSKAHTNELQSPGHSSACTRDSTWKAAGEIWYRQ